ncbi:MAG: DUF2256 domain-containing protein, partial [Planctomycetes bacterium]|nr:DUF2256 domain-containing protein [Planctomycetota bacterium]
MRAALRLKNCVAPKVCVRCGRLFAWRKKWAKN